MVDASPNPDWTSIAIHVCEMIATVSSAYFAYRAAVRAGRAEGKADSAVVAVSMRPRVAIKAPSDEDRDDAGH